MNEIKLKDLIELIIEEMNDPWIKSRKVNFIDEWMLKRVDIIGESNENIPHRIDIHKERKRENNNLLTGEEIIRGKYLVYWCNGHDGFETISEHNDLKEVEDFILDFHDNSFINMILVFQDGKIKKWEVTGPSKTYEVINKEIKSDGIPRSTIKTTIHAKLKWLN